MDVLPAQQKAHEILGRDRLEGLAARAFRVAVHAGEQSPGYPLRLGCASVVAALHGKALTLQRDHAETLNNRGNALLQLGRAKDALASYDQALTVKPDYAEAFENRGLAMLALKRATDALASFDRALALRPNYVQALNNRGNALRALKRPDEALVSYDRALALWPHFAEALIKNANDEPQTFADSAFREQAFVLHPLQVASHDPIVRTASFNPAEGAFTVPGRTAAVFVRPRPALERRRLLSHDVEMLVAQGFLTDGRGKSLLAKLRAAAASLEAGHEGAAANQLGAFVNEVLALIRSNHLPAAQGQPLADEAKEIVVLLGG